jgi:CRISPR-associated protein Csm3
MELVRHIEVKGTIRCVNAVRVGGVKETIEIGAIDNPIIRNPVSNHPFLPGSSIKGKMRSALELGLAKSGVNPHGPNSFPTLTPRDVKDETGKIVRIELHPCACGTCVVCKLFGCGSPDKTTQPTRLLFRDALLTHEWAAILGEAARERGIFFAEVKPGLLIDRKRLAFAEGRFFNYERVPEGTEFDFECTLRLFSHNVGVTALRPTDFVIDDEAELPLFRRVLAQGLRFLESEGIGGKVGSGSGKVAFGLYREVKNAVGEEERMFEPGKLRWGQEETPWDFRNDK